MAVPRPRAPHAPGGSLRAAAGLASDEVELYHRTYTTLLRSSGETLLRVLEAAHRTMGSSLHPPGASDEVGPGAARWGRRCTRWPRPTSWTWARSSTRRAGCRT